jgi:hypothetical protein
MYMPAAITSKRPARRPGNQRSPFGEHGVDLLDTQLGEDDLGDLGRFAGDGAVGFGVGERDSLA